MTKKSAALNASAFAFRCCYIDQKMATELDGTYEHIIGQIFTMIRQPGKWTLDQGRGGQC